MCGVFGIVGAGGRDVRQDIFDALTVLQHRGQDAAGMATTSPAGQLHVRRAGGLVRDAIRTRHMLRLTGNAGIGHVRYPTAGAKSGANAPNNAQPFVVSSPYGLALSHNGNLTNAAELGAEVRRVDQAAPVYQQRFGGIAGGAGPRNGRRKGRCPFGAV